MSCYSVWADASRKIPSMVNDGTKTLRPEKGYDRLHELGEIPWSRAEPEGRAGELLTMRTSAGGMDWRGGKVCIL